MSGSMRTPLLLIPGHLCDHALWAHQTRHLADIAEMSVATMDGGSSVDAMARAILAKAPGRFAMAGLSMGGYVALEIMRKAPQRVERLALLDTAAGGNSPTATDRRRRHMALAREGKFDAVVEEFCQMVVPPARYADAALMDEMRRMMHRIGPELAVQQQQALLDREDMRATLGRISCPTLVLCGRQDTLTPLAGHEEIARGVPEAKLVVVEACGHMAPMEQPEAVTAVLRYWLQA
jgi:pimeloyl-ACP methyl ester carboxylesterase